MKEATGELSMVVITIVAVIAVLLIWGLVKDDVQEWVTGKFNDLENSADEMNEQANPNP